MNDPLRARRGSGGFDDLIPWADPYIAALIEKLRNSVEESEDTIDDIFGELPPPLDNDESTDDGWPADWARRDGPSP
jgi:hypothetical protein